MSIEGVFVYSLNALLTHALQKNGLSADPRAVMGLLADLNKAVIPKYFLFDFINTDGYIVRHRLVFVKVQN